MMLNIKTINTEAPSASTLTQRAMCSCNWMNCKDNVFSET